MPVATELIRQYLTDAVSAEQNFESQLRSFASEGDDEEVQLAFAQHADETRSQHERLTERLLALGEPGADDKNAIPSLGALAPKFADAGNTIEERLVQNLIKAFCIESGEYAMYEALACVACAAGDFATETLAREIQLEEERAAERIWHFLPSRSKIAFNILTADEVDPAVETKVGQGLI